MSAYTHPRRIMIDPGTCTHGIVVTQDGAVLHADSAATSGVVEDWLRALPSTVLIERIQAHGLAGNDVIRTAEWSTHFRAIALEQWRCSRPPEVCRHHVVWIYRRHVKAALDVSGRNADSVIRSRLKSEYGERAWQRPKLCPKRKTKSHNNACPTCGGSGYEREPGWLSEVTGHAVQALALSAAYDLGAREVTG